MFSLAQNAARSCTHAKPKQVKLLGIGLNGAGKSTIFAALAKEPLEAVSETIGFESKEFKLCGISIVGYDLGGGERIRDIWSQYYAEVHAVMFVVDSADASRYREARTAIWDAVQHQYITGKPVLVVANKSDLCTNSKANAISTSLSLPQLAGMKNKSVLHVAECCATGQRSGHKPSKELFTAIRWLLQEISANWLELSLRQQRDTAEHEAAEAEARAAKRERVRKIREEREMQEALAEAKSEDAASAAPDGSLDRADVREFDVNEVEEQGSLLPGQASTAPAVADTHIDEAMDGRDMPSLIQDENDASLHQEGEAPAPRLQPLPMPNLAPINSKPPPNVVGQARLSDVKTQSKLPLPTSQPRDHDSVQLSSATGNSVFHSVPDDLGAHLIECMQKLDILADSVSTTVHQQWACAASELWSLLCRQAKGGKRFSMDRLANAAKLGWDKQVVAAWDEQLYGQHLSQDRNSRGFWTRQSFASERAYNEYTKRCSIATNEFQGLSNTSKEPFRVAAEAALAVFLDQHPRCQSIRIKHRNADIHSRLHQAGLLQVSSSSS
eukprot:TRINITY_DN10442_c0_g1_i2.p1 TRINITY_DN10442_c0_g1~~TRINITY_DN10442_c0_g1_i2.p1  ORF type:complete len:556 (+),score=65.19 TRINITY_DN10442_c0_g1_i2:30-1697(+)